MPAGEAEFRPRWRICSNCRKVRFMEPYVVVDGKRQSLGVTACSQCRARTKRFVDDFVAKKRAAQEAGAASAPVATTPTKPEDVPREL